MKISQTGIDLIKGFEGYRLNAYQDTRGIWTIGYGHTGGVKKGQVITAEQAEAYLRADLVKAEKAVGAYSKYGWNQNEFDALVSFAYNIGNITELTARGIRSRTVIADKMLLYIKAGGVVLNGLIRRRNAERLLFLTPCGKTPGNGTEQSESGIVARPTIKKGSKGAYVEYLQEYLASKGYYIGFIDSVFGSMLEKAVMLYQYDTGLVFDGIVGAKTWDMVAKNPELKVKVFSLAANGGKYLSENFKVSEFRCKDGSDKILVDVDFVQDKLQKIRDHFGAAVTVNSGYRTIPYNTSIKGASSSYHLYGRAFDIAVKGHTPQEVARYAQSLGITGIIQYNGFTHVDSRPGKYWARDDNGKVTVKNNF